MKKIFFTVSFPCSVNNYLNNGNKCRVKTAEARAYNSATEYDVIAQGLNKNNPWLEKDKSRKLFFYVDLFLPDNRRRDVDNYSKVLLDSLTGLVFEDDSNIKRYCATKHAIKDYEQIYKVKGFALVRIFDYEPEAAELVIDSEEVIEKLKKTPSIKALTGFKNKTKAKLIKHAKSKSRIVRSKKKGMQIKRNACDSSSCYKRQE